MEKITHELRGGNMGIDLVDPAPWPQDPCPWNIAEGSTAHRCAIKNVSICKYFQGVKDPDIILSSYIESPYLKKSSLMPNSAPLAILEQLASRICHDLISPIGAIGNGLELLEEMGDVGDAEAIKLISYSAAQSAAKLAAFRLAYGAGGRDPNIKPEDVQRTFGKYISGDGKIKQAWDPFGPLGIDPKKPAFCKMLMLTLMLAGECLPRGGMVLVDAGAEGDTIVTAQGQDAHLRDGVEGALSGTVDAETIDPRLVHPAMVGLLAARYGYSVNLREKSEGKVALGLSVKG